MQDRRQLITEGVKQIKYALAQVIRAVPTSVDKSDLISEGILCVMQCLDDWDVNHPSGAKFSTYAFHRIKGSMLDLIRKQYHYDSTQISQPMRDLEKIQGGDKGVEAEDTYVSAMLRTIDMNFLSRADKILLELYFMRGQTQADIAHNLNVSESWICVKIWKVIEIIRRRNNIPVEGTWVKRNGHR